MCATLPPPPETSYAKEGTAAHKMAEDCLTAGLDPEDFVSRFVEGVEVSPEMAEAVRVYTDFVRGLIAEHGGERATIEQRVKLDMFDADLFGTNDFVLITPDGTLYTADFKYGAGVPVAVEDNPQLKYYALGALMAAGGGVERVVLSVIQPRCKQAGEPIRSWETTPMDLMEFGLELAAAAAETRKANAPFSPGKWCRFCPAGGVCPALHKQALAVAAVEFEDITEEGLSAEELGKRLALADDLEAKLKAWIGPLRQHAYNEALRGRMPAGRKFVARRGRRAWNDGTLAMGKAAQLFKVNRTDLFDETPISPAAFEKLLGKAAVKDFVADHAETKSSGFSLVSLSDKREALTPQALSEFEPIEEPDA